MVDMNKKYRTRDGRAVRILATDVKHLDFPVVGTIVYENGTEGNFQWAASGSYYPGGNPQSDNDLVPVPTKHEGWVIVSNKSGLPLADNRRGVWMDRNDAIAFCNFEGEHFVCITWVD